MTGVRLRAPCAQHFPAQCIQLLDPSRLFFLLDVEVFQPGPFCFNECIELGDAWRQRLFQCELVTREQPVNIFQSAVFCGPQVQLRRKCDWRRALLDYYAARERGASIDMGN